MKVTNKTIIITDPCYIIKEKVEKNPFEFPYTIGFREKLGKKNWEKLRDDYIRWEEEHDDWKKCNYGENMEALGITHYICRDTLYGDWSCTTYNSDTKEVIGRFCADAGMVAVFELDEVRVYNPNIDAWIKKHPWCITTIENFTGDVNFKEIHLSGVYTKKDEYESNGKIYCKEGETWEDTEVRVVGRGNINFITAPTGL